MRSGVLNEVNARQEIIKGPAPFKKNGVWGNPRPRWGVTKGGSGLLSVLPPLVKEGQLF